MKKAFCIGILAVLCGNLWAAEFSLSAGAGGLVGGLFTRYKATSGLDKIKQEVNQFNYGGLVFFDATYAELAVTIQGGANSYEETMIQLGNPTPMAGKGWETMLGFSLLGKYPFNPAEKFSIFPLIGIEYQLSLAQKRRKDGGITYKRTDGVYEYDKYNLPYKNSVWNSFWIHVGVGTDFKFIKSFFLRSELLYSFRLMTDYESDGLEKMKKVLGDPSPSLGGLTSGPSLRLSAGWRFWGL